MVEEMGAAVDGVVWLSEATAAVQALYCNPDEQTTWREIRKASRAWRQRNGKLTELIHRQFADDDGRLRAGAGFEVTGEAFVAREQARNFGDGPLRAAFQVLAARGLEPTIRG